MSYRYECINSIEEPVIKAKEVAVTDEVWQNLLDKNVLSSGTINSQKTLRELVVKENVSLVGYGNFPDGHIHLSALTSISNRMKN